MLAEAGTWSLPCPIYLESANVFGIPRYIVVNTGSIRFDLVKGPFTFDDSFIVSPFPNPFRYIASVPYSIVKDVLVKMNSAVLPDKRASSPSNFGSMPLLNTPEE